MLQQDPDERIVLVVRRTLFGIAAYVIFGIFALSAYLYALFQIGLDPGRISNISIPMLLAVLTAMLLLVEAVVYLVIRVYLANTLTLTTESIVQRLQITPFANKVSQLGLDDIEDVTIAQPGFLASLLNYGTLTVETAGEQQNFIFPLAKNPARVSQAIITTKEAFEARKHNQHQD